MSVGFRRSGSGYIDPKQVEGAEDDLLEHVNIDCKHDVPFVAGMSEDGDTLYVDKEAYPEVVKQKLLKCLIVHEMVEHCLMDDCGLPYEEAHAIATAAEESCARACGYDMGKYNQAWDKIIRKVSSRAHFKDVPDDLDTEPYAQDGDPEEKKDTGLLSGGKAYGPSYA